jgi:hypothetical protein
VAVLCGRLLPWLLSPPSDFLLTAGLRGGLDWEFRWSGPAAFLVGVITALATSVLAPLLAMVVAVLLPLTFTEGEPASTANCTVCVA